MGRVSILAHLAARVRAILAGAGALAALAAAATLAPAAASAAPWVINCPSGCLLQPDVDGDGNPLPFTQFGDDYTVPADGRTWLWTFRLVSDDPNATVVLDDPNQVDGTRFLGGGGQEFFFPTFTFDQHVAPRLTTIVVGTGKDFYNCTPSTPVGQVCGETLEVFGNGTDLRLNSSLPATLYTSAVMVPEPAAWTLMIAGLGAAGAMLRRARRAAVA
jgi:hypothetical protein